MKKSGIVLLVAVAACALGLPPVLGGIGQTAFENRIATINANELLAIDIAAFERGLYSSTAVLEIGLSPVYVARLEELGEPDGIGPAFELLADNEITVVVDMTHGPVSLAGGLFFGLNRVHAYPAADAPGNIELQRHFGMDSLFDFRGRVGYGGTLAYEAEIPAIDYADETSRFSTSIWRLEGTFDGRRIASETALDDLYYSAGPIAMTLRDLRGVGDNEFLTRNVALGTYDIDIGSATIANELDPATPMLEAAGLELHSEVEFDDAAGVIDGSLAYMVGEAQIDGTTMIADGRLELGVADLDVAALKDYADVANRYASVPPNDAEMALVEILPIVERLLAAEPSLSLDPVSAIIDGERFVMTLHVTSDATALPQAGALDLLDPSLWLGVVGLDAEATLAKPLAETLAVKIMSMQLGNAGMTPDQAEQMARAQAGFMLVTLVGQGMLVDDGETYTAALRFADGVFTLNGNELPFGFPP